MKTDSSVPQPGLIRALGPLMATAVVVGTVIGSGIFKKPQVVAENVPHFGLAALVWILGGVLALLGALALAEVAVLFPRAGGNYVFLREGYGRLAGFLWGWVEFWIIRGASLAALATIFTESFHDVLRELSGSVAGSPLLNFWAQKWLTVGVILALALVNVRGVRWGGGLQLVITTVKVGSLVGIAVLPFLVVALARPGSVVAPPRPENLVPVWPAAWRQVDLSNFATALLGVLWAYHGWMNIALVAEEVRRPQRNIPLALLAGTGIIMALYLGANLAYYLIIPQPQMAGLKETTVATEFSLRLLGSVGATVASAAVMCSVFGALNGSLLVGPRLLYAMGEDGLAPRALRAVHPRYRTPALSILVMAGWSSLLLVAAAALQKVRLPVWQMAGWTLDLNVPETKPLFDIMTDFAMFGAVIFETLAVATIFIFRWRLPQAERPYRCWGYPVVPVLYMVLPALVLANMFVKQQTEALVGVVFIALGAGVYYLIEGSKLSSKA
jgi:amino acid transporter